LKSEYVIPRRSAFSLNHSGISIDSTNLSSVARLHVRAIVIKKKFTIATQDSRSMGTRGTILAFGFVTITFSIVVFVHALRLLLIPDFETRRISLTEFVARYNRYARVCLFADLCLLLMCLIPPISSLLLTLEMLPLVGFSLYQWWTGQLEIDVVVAVRSLRSLKVTGIVRIIGLFLCVCTCIGFVFVLGFRS
jgi:hypothetical protein